MIGDNSKASCIGTPTIQGVKIIAKIINQYKSNKIIIFKKKRRQNYRRKNGHRQKITEVKILDIIQ
jgi:large subunit ribosomal protein L21